MHCYVLQECLRVGYLMTRGDISRFCCQHVGVRYTRFSVHYSLKTVWGDLQMLRWACWFEGRGDFNFALTPSFNSLGAQWRVFPGRAHLEASGGVFRLVPEFSGDVNLAISSSVFPKHDRKGRMTSRRFGGVRQSYLLGSIRQRSEYLLRYFILILFLISFSFVQTFMWIKLCFS